LHHDNETEHKDMSVLTAAQAARSFERKDFLVPTTITRHCSRQKLKKLD